MDFVFEKPSLVPGGNPASTSMTRTELNHLRKTTRWSAALLSIEIVLKHLGLLREFLRREMEASSKAAASRPMQKCLGLLETPRRIGELALIQFFISPMADWIAHSQGRQHTFSGQDRREIEHWMHSLKSTARRLNGGPGDVPSSVRKSLSGLIPSEDVDALGEDVPGLARRLFYATQPLKTVSKGGQVMKTGSKLGDRFQAALQLSRVIDIFVPSHCKYIRPELEAALRSAGSFEDFAKSIGGEPLAAIAEKIGIRGMAVNMLAEMGRYLEYVLEHARLNEEFPPLNDLWGPAASPFPSLAALARAVLSLMVSNAPIESAFSSWRSIDVPRRQNAADELQYAYFFLQFNKINE